MRSRHSFRHTPHTFPPKGPSGTVRMGPSHSFRHTPHTLRGPIGAPPKVPVAQFACVPATHFGTPLARCVAP
eukprot:4762778-Pyramimonas_sp.AAC.1